MDEVVSVDPVLGRFERVLRFYWDGIAVPPFVAGKADTPRRTFLFRLLGYSPDYHGEVTSVPITSSTANAVLFVPLCNAEDKSSSMSARIGSHYSPLVGLFRFYDVRGKSKRASDTTKKEESVRIPAERCEDASSVFPDSTLDYRQFIRMRKLIELYEPLVKEYSRMNQDSLRRIVVMATQGLDESAKRWVVREMSIVSDEYTKWLCEAIFFYMCANSTFRRIVAPLQVMTRPAAHPFTVLAQDSQDRRTSQDHFVAAKQGLQDSSFWSKRTRGYFEAVRVCWEKNFRRLALFDVSVSDQTKRSEVFLEQLTSSMRAALAEIRVEFYSSLEDFFYSYVAGAKEILVMDIAQIRQSRFRPIFLGTRVFLVNMLRDLLFENLKRLVSFFDCNGKGGRRLTRRVAAKHPLLQFQLVIGDRYVPRSPAFSHFRFGILDLFDELLSEINNFPLPERALLRTLPFENTTTIAVADAVETACYRTSIMGVFDEVASTIDEVAHRYLPYADLPTINACVARGSSLRDIQDYTNYLREKLCGVEAVSADVVYSGCFAIVCTSVKQQYRENWVTCTERFYKEYHASVLDLIQSTDIKCTEALGAIQKTPKTVVELEEYLDAVKAAEVLAEKVKKTECEQVVTRFGWMEEAQIPADAAVYDAALRLMKWPARLLAAADRSDTAKDQCRPILLAELDRLRTDARDSIKTLATGITELYHMFNLEISDIAAQTCAELRELVDHVERTVETIHNQELSLGLSVVDRFEDLPSLLNHFAIIEQFWTAIYKATGLREFYVSPVSSLNAEKAVEKVREWRRLIHTSARGLRGFVPLVRLGQQQELALAKFEALEDLLRLLSTPGLRKSHWKEIARLVAARLGDEVAQVGDMTISLQTLLDAGIAEFVPELERIASQARSDYETESKLEEMKSTAKRSYFHVEPASGEAGSPLVIAPACRHNVMFSLEQFVERSCVLRRNPVLSPLVFKAVKEWETASEHTRDTFLRWGQLEERWGTLSPFFSSLEKAQGRPSNTDTDTDHGEAKRKETRKAILETLKRAADAFHVIYTTVSKPQFSLYTAIVQESITDNLSLAKLAMDEAMVALTGTFEHMRVTFPRFNYVTDRELTTFLTAYDTRSLLRLLPSMYARLNEFTVEGSAVTSFSSLDGGTIPVAAGTSLCLSDEPAEVWMGKFDRCLTTSLFRAICACANEYTQGDIDIWISNWCTQLVVMALRLTHTKDLRDAIQLAGNVGLRAYKVKVDSVVEEITRLAAAAAADADATESPLRCRLASALVYMQHAANEVELALSHNVVSCAQLDTTVLLQTFATETTITVRLMGMEFAYGFEFLGDCQLSFMSLQLLEKVVAMLTFCGGAGGTPILCGGSEKEHALELTSQILGSFLVRVQCCEVASLPALRPHLRGAIELGSMLCVQDCEKVPLAVYPTLATCIRLSREALRQPRGTPVANLPLGREDGLALSVPVSPRFLAVLTTENAEMLPRSFSLDFRTIHVRRVGCAATVRSYLTVFGLHDTKGICSTAFGALYEQFREADSATFSDAALLAVLRRATMQPMSGAATPDAVRERLLLAFLNVFSPRIREEGRLQQLLTWNLEHTLGTCDTSDACRAALEQLKVPIEKLKSDDIYACFANMMSTCTNAVVVGSGFSGKARLWRRWVGSAEHTVFSPSLMTSEDFYGSQSRPGFLASLGKSVVQSSGPYFVIVEDGDLSSNSLWAAWPQFSRVPGLGACFITSPRTHIIVSTHTLQDTTPRLAADFGIFYLPPFRNWRKLLRECLRRGGATDARGTTAATGMPTLGGGRGGAHSSMSSAAQLSEIALGVMEALLPSVFMVAHPEIAPLAFQTAGEKPTVGIDGGREANRGLSDEESNQLLALCQRCASLHRRWFQHATQEYDSMVGKVFDNCLVDDKAFTAQCAVFAVCWSSGLALEESERHRIGKVLLDEERALQRLAESFGIAEPLLPPRVLVEKEEGGSSGSGTGTDILDLVVTRGGWKTVEEAGAFGINLSWSTYSHVSAQSRAWAQRFLLPSRLPALGAVECLLNCGQSVLLCGSRGSGKSTLLQTIPSNDRWASQLVSTDKSLSPTFVQEEMLASLSRRSDGRFGPALGHKLVVCIDDVHLSQDVHPSLPLVGRLISFCDKFSGVSTPASGLVPTTDVVFLGTTQERKYDARLLRACVEVRLPDLVGAELVQGLWTLFEAACGRKRVDGFPGECASLLTVAHSTFARLLPDVPAHLLDTAPERVAPSLRNGSAGTRPISASSPRGNPLVVESERFLPWRLSDVLRVAEFTRQQLVSPTTDVQVATNLFSAIKTLYTAYMTSSGAAAEVSVFKSRLGDAAQQTLGRCLRDVDFAAIVAKERAAELEAATRKRAHAYSPGNCARQQADQDARRNDEMEAAVSDGDRDRVAEWITEFQMTVDEVREEVLEDKFSYASSAKPRGGAKRNTLASSLAAAEEDAGGGDGDTTGGIKGPSTAALYVDGKRSVLITYARVVVPQGHSRAATPSSRPGSGSGRRASGSRRASVVGLHQRMGGIGTPRRGSLHGASGGTAVAGLVCPTMPAKPVSKTYQTTWLTAALVGLYRTVHQHDSHAVLIGEHVFGVQRLLRLFCSATRVPLAVLRANRESRAFDGAVKTELRSLVMFAYTNDVRTNAFFPYEMLTLPGVMRQLDIIMRSGEINELFTAEERAALARGYRHTHRGAAPLTSIEYADMRRRVHRNLRFLVLVPSHAALLQMASDYPLLTRLMTIPLGNSELTRDMLREIAMGILTEERVGETAAAAEEVKSNRFPLRVVNDNEALAELLSLVFECIRREHPTARPENLMELVREVRRLRETQLGSVLQVAEAAAILHGRADEATGEVMRGTERASRAAAELSTARATIASLRVRLGQEEKQLLAWREALSGAKADLANEERIVEEQERKIQEDLQKAEKALSTAAAKLRRVKSAFVRSLAVLRLPEKGVLLVKAIYRLLNEELPNYGNSPTTLWTLAMRYVCSPEFPAKMASRLPGKEKDPASLLAMEEELSQVRYGNASPYAQLIADFILAYMGSIRTGILVAEEDEPRLERQREELILSKNTIEDLSGKEEEALATMAATAALVEEMESDCIRLGEVLDHVAEREKRLLCYVGLADRFAPFVTKKHVEALSSEAGRAEGDTILVSAYFSTLASYANGLHTYEELRQLLAKKGLPTSSLADSPCRSLLFSGHKTLLSPFVSPDLPFPHGAALYGLLRRVACRWQLYGGVCATFERSLKEYLALECNGCAVVSALDPNVMEQILRAMKEGEGVLLRDADSAVAADILRELSPLLERLLSHHGSSVKWAVPESHAAVVPDLATAMKRGNTKKDAASASAKRDWRTTSSSSPTTSTEETTGRISFRAFDQDIDVNPKFFLVGTSTGLFPLGPACPASGCANVVNLFTPLPREERFHALVLGGNLPKSAAEELCERRERYYRSMQAFMQAHHVANDLLWRDLDDIIGGEHAETELHRIDSVLVEVETHDGQVAHVATQLQSLLRQQRESWEPLEASLHASADVLGFLEGRKLGRPWDDRVLDSFVAGMTTLSPELTGRLAPQLFVDLPREEKFFYALVNYLDAVIQAFSCGWPAPVRGIFSLYLFAGVALTCEEVLRQRGVLFPHDVELLKKAQWSVLQRALANGAAPGGTTASAQENSITFITHPGSANSVPPPEMGKGKAAAIRRWLLEQYRESGDALLNDLAAELASPNFFSLSSYSFTTSTTVSYAATSSTAEVRRETDEADHSRAFCSADAGSSSLIAYFFRCVGELDYEHGEYAALQLVGSFFSSVKDANAVSSGKRRGDGNVDGASAGTLAGAPGTSLLRSGVAREANLARKPLENSVASGSAAVVVADALDQPLSRANSRRRFHDQQQQQQQSTITTVSSDRPIVHELHSLSALLCRASGNGLPLCFPARIPNMALKQLRQEAARSKWAFRWYEADSVLKLDRAGYHALQCFHRKPLNCTGHLVAICVEYHEEKASPADIRPLVEGVHRLLSTYQSYRGSLTAISGASGGFPVCLVLVCAFGVHDLLWGTSGERAEIRRGRCLYVNTDFPTPQSHLLSLLQSNTIQNALGTFSTTRRALRGGDDRYLHSNGAGGRSSRHLGDGEIADHVPNGKNQQGREGTSCSTSATPTTLETAAALVAKELAMVHVGVAARQALLLENWEACGSLREILPSPLTFPCFLGSHFNDDDSGLVALLEQLHHWVQRALRVADAIATPEGPGSGTSSDTGRAAAMCLANLPAGTIHASQTPGTGGQGEENNRGMAASASPSLGPGVRPISSLKASAPVPPASVVRDEPVAVGEKAPLGRQAYLFYRSQRSLWRHLHADTGEMGISGLNPNMAAAITPSPDSTVRKGKPINFASLQRNLPTLCIDESALRSSATGSASRLLASPGVLSPSLPSTEEKRLGALRQLRHAIYCVFQKFAYELYAEGGGSDEERVAVRRAVATLVVPPQNGHSSASRRASIGEDSPSGTRWGVGNATVAPGAMPVGVTLTEDADMGGRGMDTGSCNLTGADSPYSLLLHANSDFAHFASVVRNAGSDLAELLGDGDALHHFRASVHRRLTQLLFSSPPEPLWAPANSGAVTAVQRPEAPSPPAPTGGIASSLRSRLDEHVRGFLSGSGAVGEVPRAPPDSSTGGTADARGGEGEDTGTAPRQSSPNHRQDEEEIAHGSVHAPGRRADRCPAPRNSTAALLWEFEECGLRRLYDGTEEAAAPLTEEQREMVLDTARSITSTSWLNLAHLGPLLGEANRATTAHEDGEGEPLGLWLPALTRPYTTITLMLRTMHEAVSRRLCGGGGGGGHASGDVAKGLIPPRRRNAMAGEPRLMLVVTKRRLLAPTDIVASRACLSPLLLAELNRFTHWRQETEEAVVVAFRFVMASTRRGRGGGGAQSTQTYHFYDTVKDGKGARHMVHMILHAPQAPHNAGNGLSFLWRTPEQANYALAPEITAHGMEANSGRSSGDRIHRESSSSTDCRPLSLRTVSDATVSGPPTPGKAQDREPRFTQPTFVTATDELVSQQSEANGECSSRGDEERVPAPRLRYAVSLVPIPFHTRALHENDVHAATRTATAPHSVPRAKDRWRTAVELPMCVVFEEETHATPHEGSAASQAPSDLCNTLATQCIEVTALSIPFPHPGSLGHFVICD